PKDHWPFFDFSCDWLSDLWRMLEGFALFNPHLTISLDWFGQKHKSWLATDPKWKKWLPSDPTSPHWYGQAHLQRLVGAYVTHERDNGQTNGDGKLVNDFLGEFDGLSGSGKRTKVLNDAKLKRVRLSELANRKLDTKRIGSLLNAMQRHTRPVKAQ